MHDARDLTYNCDLRAALVERTQEGQRVEPDGVISTSGARHIIGVLVRPASKRAAPRLLGQMASSSLESPHRCARVSFRHAQHTVGIAAQDGHRLIPGLLPSSS